MKNKCFLNAQVFFVGDIEKEIIEEALTLARTDVGGENKAQKRAAALTMMAKVYIGKKTNEMVEKI
jgi:hypothetical protein